MVNNISKLLDMNYLLAALLNAKVLSLGLAEIKPMVSALLKSDIKFYLKLIYLTCNTTK